MAKLCPNKKTDTNWIALAEMIGEHEADKLFFRHDDKPDPSKYALELITKVSPEIKINAVKLMSDQFELIEEVKEGSDKTHYYIDERGTEIDSVSAKLDTDKSLKFGGESIGETYSAQGTKLHSVWEDYINGSSFGTLKGKYSEVPINYLLFVEKFVKKLRETGTVSSEVIVGFNGETDTDSVAGTVDIIHYKFDGTYDVYDLKTSHQTKKYNTKDLWNPNAYDGFKAKRYSSQLMTYSEMLSRAIGHPPSNQYIIPVEVYYSDVENPNDGIARIKTSPRDNNARESIEDYDFIPKARSFVDKFFKNKSQKETNLKGQVDLSDRVLSHITGVDVALQGRAVSRTAEAENRWNGGGTDKNDKRFYFNRVNQRVTLNSDIKSEQLAQIVEEYVNPSRENGKDHLNSFINYAEKGDDKTFANLPQNSPLIKLAKWYRGNGFKVQELASIEGFQKKGGWLLLTKNNRIDLIYDGAESLDAIMDLRDSQGAPVTSKNLFGAMSKNADSLYGTELKNTFLDFKKIEATLIAAQLLQVNPNSSIGKMAIYSSKNTPKNYAAVVHPVKVLNTLDKVLADDSIELDPTMTQLLSTIDRTRFDVDPIQAYLEYMQDHELALDRGIEFGIREFRQNKLNKQNLEEAVLKAIRKNVEDGTFDQESSEETFMLNSIYYGINDVRIWDNPISGDMRKMTQMRTDFPGELMGFINTKIFTQLRKFREGYWQDYKVDALVEFDKFFKASGYSATSVRDRTISDTTRFYEPLFEHKMMTHPDGTRKLTKSHELVKIGSDEYNKLAEPAKKFHSFIMKQFENAARQGGIENWDPYKMPLVKSTLVNSLYKASRKEGSYRNVAKSYWGRLADNFEFTGESEGLYKANNWYYGQADEGTRESVAGYTGDTIYDLEKYNSFETNLEVVSDMFMINAQRVKHMDVLAQMFASAHSLYDFMATNLYDPRYSKNAELIEAFKNKIVHNRDPGSGTKLHKAVTVMNTLVGWLTLGYNIKSPIIVGLGQEMLLWSRGVAATISKSENFDLDSLGKSSKWMIKPSNREKTTLLLNNYGIHDMDISALSHGQHRTGNKSIAQSKHAFGLFRYGDKVSKGHFLIAQMIKDGSLVAYTVVDGKLKYDQDADPRYKGVNGELLKNALLQSMNNEGSLDINGRMKRGYDDKLNQKFKLQVDRMFGGYDQDMKALVQHASLGKLFLMHKGFMPAVVGRMLRTPGLNIIEGNYAIQGEGENKIMKWKGTESEGLVYSMLAGLKWLRDMRDNPKPLDPHQRENLNEMAADSITMGLAMMIAASLAYALDDDDEKEWALAVEKGISGALRDLLVAYNLNNIEDLAKPMAIDYTYKLNRKIFNSLMGSVEEGDPEEFLNVIMEAHSIPRQLSWANKQMGL